MQLKNYLLTLLTIPLFSGCYFSWSEPEPRIEIQTKIVERNIPIKSKPKKVQLTNIKLYVVTEDNYEEFKKEFTEKNGDLVFVAISVKDYENLSLNMSDIRRYIKQQKELILYYEESLKPKEKETNK